MTFADTVSWPEATIYIVLILAVLGFFVALFYFSSRD